MYMPNSYSYPGSYAKFWCAYGPIANFLTIHAFHSFFTYATSEIELSCANLRRKLGQLASLTRLKINRKKPLTKYVYTLHFNRNSIFVTQYTR